MNVLSVTNARKSFGAVKALDGASLDLRKGELLALLGPNGAGKTTLIRAIAGRVRLDAGEITLFGTPLGAGRTPPELGIVPQEIALYPLLTARENLAAFGELQGLRRRGAARRRSTGRCERTGLARPRRRAGQAVLRRHEAAPQHRLRRPPPAAHRAARRADGRRRPAEPRSDLRHARRPGEPGRVAAADDAPSRGGRGALLAHGDHRSRQGHRRRARWRSWSTGRSGGIGWSRCGSTRRWPTRRVPPAPAHAAG